MFPAKKHKTVFDPHYERIIKDLVNIRYDKGLTTREFGAKSGYSQCFIGRTETKERRLDLVEVIYYMKYLGLSKKEIKSKLVEWADLFVE